MFNKELFKGKTALVTGGRSGIGYAIAKMMLEHGAEVTIASRKKELLETAAKELEEFGTVHYHPCDIRDSEQVIALANFVKEKSGRLDILVNNAGGQFPAVAEMINDKGWNAVINNNLNGTFYMCREMANHFFLPQKEGVIVNIIANIFRGFPGMIHTGAARAGVDNMSKTMAVEWGEFGVRINCIAPGIIESSGLDQYPPPIQELFDQARKAIPSGRFGTVDEVAQAVCFMASPLSAYINGTTLYIDGAQHLHYNGKGLSDVMRSFIS